ncbi:MAG: hypothetical protein LBV46_04060, partial [Bacteroidales bacterium]|nr:hypothetical protein [Bacteroidales bacterium]
MYIKKCFLLLMIVCFASAVSAQKMKVHEQRFIFQSSLGFVAGVGDFALPDRHFQNRTSAFTIQQLLGYQFNPYVHLGVGAGLNFWKRTAFIPLFAGINVNFIDRRVSPLWYLNVGYSFKWYMKSDPEPITRVIHGATPGIFGETGLGVKFKVIEKLSVLFSVNYQLQQSQINYSIIQPGEVDFSQYATN